MGLKAVAAAQRHTDLVYQTAVTRLRKMLVPRTTEHDTRSLSKPYTANTDYHRTSYYNPFHDAQTLQPDSTEVVGMEDLLAFIDKQAQCIIQLETDTNRNRTELTHILGKVEEVMLENESLHGQLQVHAIGKGVQGEDKNSFRISELETELFKSRQNLRMAQEEILKLKSEPVGKLKLQSHSTFSKFSCELHLAEIETIARERNDLTEKVAKLEIALLDLKSRETEAMEKVKSSLDLVDQTRKDKTILLAQSKDQAEEIAQLQKRIRLMITENVQNEGNAEVGKYHTAEVTRLKTELSEEIQSCSQARAHLETERRRGRDLRSDFEERTRQYEEFRKQMELRVDTLETQLSQTIQRKTKAETDLMAVRLQAEQVERDGKQEISRFSAELVLLRTELTNRNSDMEKCDQVILALQGRISELEQNINLENNRRQEAQIQTNEKVIKVTAEAVQQKYATERREFENIIQKQNILMDKLRAECYNLAQKLEEIVTLHKKEQVVAENEKAEITQQYQSTLKKCSDLEQKVYFYSAGQDQMRNRVQFLEEEEKVHTQKIVNLLTKQSLIMKQKDKLEGELTRLRSSISQMANTISLNPV